MLYIRYSILSNSVATFEDVFNIFHIRVKEIKEEKSIFVCGTTSLD
jgi:hypothetical protein